MSCIDFFFYGFELFSFLTFYNSPHIEASVIDQIHKGRYYSFFQINMSFLSLTIQLSDITT